MTRTCLAVATVVGWTCSVGAADPVAKYAVVVQKDVAAGPWGKVVTRTTEMRIVLYPSRTSSSQPSSPLFRAVPTATAASAIRQRYSSRPSLANVESPMLRLADSA